MKSLAISTNSSIELTSHELTIYSNKLMHRSNEDEDS